MGGPQWVIMVVTIAIISGGGYFLFSDQSLKNAQAPTKTEVVLIEGEPENRLPNRQIEPVRKIALSPPEPEEPALVASSEASSTTNEVIDETTGEEVIEEIVSKPRELALGVGKISLEPTKGMLYACEDHIHPNDTSGRDWIRDGFWYPDERVEIDGQIAHKGVTFEITAQAQERILRGDGLPKHVTGEFPVSGNDDAKAFNEQNFSITRGNYVLTLPRFPSIAPKPSCVPKGTIAIMLSGGALHSAEGDNSDDAPGFEVFDQCDGQVDKEGYHYHNASRCLGAFTQDNLIGYAMDGFGIYGNRENGKEITNDDLDACHGHVGEVMWDGDMREMYHYHATNEFPYTIGCFKGDPIIL